MLWSIFQEVLKTEEEEKSKLEFQFREEKAKLEQEEEEAKLRSALFGSKGTTIFL